MRYGDRMNNYLYQQKVNTRNELFAHTIDSAV